ncbi:MAG: bis(5'-nucleosyl)-tetraphosphatase (symmetrical) YqeK [Eubacteriales bacterium]
MNLSAHAYILQPKLTGHLECDIQAILSQNGKEDTLAHVEAVSRINAQIAGQYALDRDKCILSGLLHDISAVLKPEDMLSYAKDNNLPLDEAEERYPFLLHQRISAIMAREYLGVSDADILSAVECHTTLKADPSPYDMALFIADKLSWDQEGTPPFYDAIKAGMEVSLEKASFAYICHMLDNGRVLYPHRWFLDAKVWLERRCR